MKDGRKTIMVVDDVPGNVQVLDAILNLEYRVIAALSGPKALELARKDPPDLFLLDVNMPEVDGIETCLHIKMDPLLENRPVIFVTSRDEAADEAIGFEAGAVDYITKPISPMIVLTRVQTHLDLAERNANLTALVEERTANLREQMKKREAAQVSLAGTLELLTNVMENVSESIASTSHAGTVTFANQNFLNLAERTGSGVLGRPLPRLFPEHEEKLTEEIRIVESQLTPRFFEAQFSRQGGGSLVLEIRLSPMLEGKHYKGIVFSALDITRKRSAERLLQHTSKMATLGEMATSIAHELNQPLNVIGLAADMLLDHVDGSALEPEFIKTRATRIAGMVARGARLTDHLRNFGRKSATVRTEFRADQPVQDALNLLQDRINKYSIEVDLQFAEDLPPVMGDSANLEQVFINLLVNSIDAMEKVEHRRISIHIYLNSEEDMIEYRLSDKGPGVSAELNNQIFKAFFTTKEPGKGTGLGLSISYGIVQTHNGRISALPSEEGALFSIQIPHKDSIAARKPLRRHSEEIILDMVEHETV